jgi:hypothetical protein
MSIFTPKITDGLTEPAKPKTPKKPKKEGGAQNTAGMVDMTTKRINNQTINHLPSTTIHQIPKNPTAHEPQLL